ncbi:protein ALP1-like [Senna tora]|uniref:Protein ALP1-like n=1 Tax=Senna tora TaxID=362788 RepID=A0A834THD0_9FABA|nr:protein ALP1-like [Senna tora]
MDQAQPQFKQSLKSSSSNTQWGLLYRWSAKLLQGVSDCSSFTIRALHGSIEDAWFDSVVVFDSDCDDDYQSAPDDIMANTSHEFDVDEDEVLEIDETGGIWPVKFEDFFIDLLVDEVHKQAKRFRKKGCKNFNKLTIIYGSTTATGRDKHPSIKSPSISEESESIELDEDAEKSKKTKTPTTSGNKRKEIIQTAIADALTVLGDNSRKKLELLEKRIGDSTTSFTSVEDSGDVNRSWSFQDREIVNDYMNALNALEGIDGLSYAKATKYIHDDPLWREMFLRMPEERKKDWNCVGAIDGTHISARVPVDKQIQYRGKKVDSTQNIMCACSFDMRFTFVMTGWEGTTNDSRIFLETVTEPENKFHKPPQVLKGHFPILTAMPSYDYKKQKYIALACCVIHNYVKIHSQGDPIFGEYGDENIELEDDHLTNEASTSHETIAPNISASQLRQMAYL